MDFIITSLQPWDIEIGSTIKNTAMEISKKKPGVIHQHPILIYALAAHLQKENGSPGK